MNPQRVAIAIVALVLLSACAGRPGRDEIAALYHQHAGEPVEEIRLVHLRNWQPVDRQSVVIWTQGNHAFLVSLSGICTGIEHAQALQVESMVSNRLSSRFDSLRVDGQRCPIDQIRPLDFSAVRRDLDALHAGGT